ncbi:D-alanyl-D-alanine carboxypeptidase family protein [Roseiterribacter gracilis]|uniref:serine-type D-Ala-D-Ala carboxypeptidase n=1 Tax=Roseiterribacter gracilis TaxID=2812848 RepID=A0A8S8XB83_9PROT|nr:D-alanyl-D-alanine carboxypeptidase [Rhodospirillales bacterium TMPK1]
MSVRRLSLFASLLVLLVAGLAHAAGPTMDTAAKQAVIIDVTTGRVLFEKNADQRMPTSSMSKIMTAYMVFDAIKQGRLKMDDMLTVSRSAWGEGGKAGGSEMFLALGESVSVENLLRGVIIASGNDATRVLAEAIAGSEGAFAEQMTARAKKLGAMNTNFRNASGLPDPEHYSTARDLAIIGMALIRDFPEHYHFYSEREFTWNKIKQGNRNPLLYKGIGVDGMKTGHTEAAGYGLTASAERNGRRIIMVMNGLPSMQARADEGANLIEFGFREYQMVDVARPGEIIDNAGVWLGTQDRVPLTVAAPAKTVLSNEEKRTMKAVVRMPQTVKAPIAQGQPIGTLVLSTATGQPIEFPLVAAQPVERLGLFGRIGASLSYLLSGPPKTS